MAIGIDVVRAATRILQDLALALLSALVLNACGSPYYTADPIEAWVVDAETGKPIEGAIVTANWQLLAGSLDTGGRKLRQLEVMETVTDRNGRFFFPGFTRLNISLDELGDEDPQILIFKSGYAYYRASNSYPLGKTSPGAHRTASVNRQKLRMQRADANANKYAFDLGFLTTGLMSIVNSGDANSVPKMIHALACERRRLAAIDPAAGSMSVPGSTGHEADCEGR
jgi:hypothetical protein